MSFYSSLLNRPTSKPLWSVLHEKNSDCVNLTFWVMFKDFFDRVFFKKGSICCFLSLARSSFPIENLVYKNMTKDGLAWRLDKINVKLSRATQPAANMCKHKPGKRKYLPNNRGLNGNPLQSDTEDFLIISRLYLLSFWWRAAHSSISFNMFTIYSSCKTQLKTMHGTRLSAVKQKRLFQGVIRLNSSCRAHRSRLK